MQETHQGFMGLRSLGRAVLEASVPEDHMRANHSFSEIVIERDFWNLKESEEVKPVREKALGKAPQAFVAILPARPKEEPLLQELDSPLVDLGFQFGTNLLESQCVSDNTLEDSVVSKKCLGIVLEIELTHLPEKVHKAFLFLSWKPGVGRIEVGHKDAPIIFRKDRLGNFGTPGLGNPVIGEPFIHGGPKPMIGAAHLPPRFIHMKVRALANRLEDLFDFDPEPLAHPLEGLGQGAFRDLEVSEALKELLDLMKGKAVVILQDHGLNEDIGTQIPVGDFLGGIGGCDHLLTMPAPVTVLLKQSDLRSCGNQILLDVLKDFLGLAQGMTAVRATPERLFNHPVNRLGLYSGETLMPGFLTRGLGAGGALGEPQGLQELLPGFAFLLLCEFSLEFLDFPFFFEDDLNEFFLGFLGKEDLAAYFHNPNNGQDGDFFEGITSGG